MLILNSTTIIISQVYFTVIDYPLINNNFLVILVKIPEPFHGVQTP